MCNYEESADSLTEAKDILLAGSQQKENFSSNLNSVLLGKIVSEIWGEKVKLVRRGPRKDRRSCYLEWKWFRPLANSPPTSSPRSNRVRLLI